MHPWGQVVLVVCAVVVTVALIAALIAMRRASERAERLLTLAEQELRPFVAEAHELMQQVRALTQETRGEVARLGALTERMEDLSGGLGRVLAAVAGLTRAGQLVGVATGLKTGLDVFLHRLRKQQGANDES
ncbi:MAG TPA: hypothetical protein VFR64_00625 [Methylomirabilota bacterium]|nr:hypothetical protein [Methylomirabilota bacterium]